MHYLTILLGFEVALNRLSFSEANIILKELSCKRVPDTLEQAIIEIRSAILLANPNKKI